MSALLRDWLEGEELVELGERFMSEVQDREFRAEQLGDLISGLFETFLPWTLSVLLEWANERRSHPPPNLPQLPGDLPTYIRWGINTPEALTLLTSGLEFRSLIHRIESVWRDEGTDQDISEWVRSLGLPEWRERFSATPPELLALLEFSRQPQGNIAALVLADETARVRLEDITGVHPSGPITVRALDNEDPPLLAVWRGDHVVGTIPNHAQQDVFSLLSTGLNMTFGLVEDEEGLMLEISLATPPT